MQVMESTLKWMARVPGQQVFRAQFSAISAPEIKAAMVCSYSLSFTAPLVPLAHSIRSEDLCIVHGRRVRLSIRAPWIEGSFPFTQWVGPP